MPEQTGLAAAFRKGLGEVGFIEGHNVTIEYRFAGNDLLRLPELVADLIHHRVAVIAATGGETGALAAKAATTSIPIVFEAGGDPVERGLVASFNRPGGNVTGITAMNADLEGKRLALLSELVPGAAPLVVIAPTDLNTPASQNRIRDVKTIGATLGRQIEVLAPVTNSREIDATFASLAQRQVRAVFVATSPIHYSLRMELATAAARHTLPMMSSDRAFVEAGALMSYGADAEDNWRLVGSYVGRILKGDKPADLPVLRPTRFEFVVNMQTARLLRIEIPPKLLALTDGVIE